MNLSTQKTALTYDDVLLVPSRGKVKSRKDIMMEWSPVIPANMASITGRQMFIHNINMNHPAILNRYAPENDIIECAKYAISRFRNKNVIYGISIGLWSTEVYELLKNIYQYVKISDDLPNTIHVCIDIAHGHCSKMEQTISAIKDRFPKLHIIAGNICTVDAAKDLVKWGADIVKVGVGNGSLCTTRLATGCGYPQLSAISDIYEGLIYAERSAKIIADGGIRNPGDIAKAIGAGADYVMTGSMFAGTDMTPMTENQSNSTYQGMASAETKLKYGLEEDFIEGVSKPVKYKGAGSTEKVFKTIDDGLRSAISYCGHASLSCFKGRGYFVKVSPSTLIENHPHFNG